ncbi:MAG TPA: MFS transporter, partial [Castellaniella sp.]|nr:MFS transporter [Castellaniella sp.]
MLAWLRLLPLILVILIDSIGYTLIIPVMSTMLLSDAPIMMAQADLSMRYVIYGVAVGVYELMMLYMAPVLGELSDRVGRRRILLICMTGVGAGFALIGAAIWLNVVLLLLLGRLLGGATAGSQAVAQAAAVDRSSAQNKSLVLNMCLLASSIGFILGPLIGGMMSHDQHVDLADFTIPVFLMAALAGIGFWLLVFTFHESPPSQPPERRIDWWMGVRGFKSAWADEAVRRLVMVFGLMQFGWGIYF